MAAALAFLAGPAPALAQQGTCLTRNMLQVDAAYSRDAAAGSYDYMVQVSNLTAQAVRFRAQFQMTGAIPDPRLASTMFQVAPRGSLVIPLANGRARADATRVRMGVTLIC
ncbi:hypothetical protein [Sediminicoccus rosea]|uniref:Uncharacterized protein n=1 Tax=Sediminicoccus rosea TaxID=1225128 RepID=A0ABZ0PHD0_9PROT|nr:hypothetical protein [Sediminicoccus rosea]WPB85125.1 hypothetical protein R9Z33_23925 [Sediminicoccus rosea]